MSSAAPNQGQSEVDTRPLLAVVCPVVSSGAVAHYFKKVDGDWVCQCGATRDQRGRGVKQR